MATERDVQVDLVPELALPEHMRGSIAVVIDVLRATTTIVHALAAGCVAVRPCLEVEEARRLADSLPAGKVLLGGERGGVKVQGFDLGNSPSEYTPKRCAGMTLVLTTTNGTKAILRAAEAERALIAAFVNFSAVCEQILRDSRPVHIICAGTDAEPALEDTILAGAIVDFLSEHQDVCLNDSARLAWDAFENHGQILMGALEISRGGTQLRALGFGADLKAAAAIDQFVMAPELRRDPLRLEVGQAGIVAKRWPK